MANQSLDHCTLLSHYNDITVINNTFWTFVYVGLIHILVHTLLHILNVCSTCTIEDDLLIVYQR